MQGETKQLTEQLWKEQTRSKALEGELSDLRLHLKGLASENSELKAMCDREKSQNQLQIERTRVEIDRMRERHDRDVKTQEERVIDALQRENTHFRALNEDIERQNR